MTQTKGLEGADLENAQPVAPPVYDLPREHLSFSQVNLWRTCAERYRREYILKQPRPSSSNLGHGRLMHHVVENLNIFKLENDGELPPLDFANDTISGALNEYTENIEIWDPKVPDLETLENVTRELIQIYVDDRLPETRPRAVELEIRYMINGRIPYKGFIDLVEKSELDTSPYKPFEGFQEIMITDIVTDLKNTTKKYGPQKVLNSMQLSLYASALGIERVAYDLLVQKKKSEFVRQESWRSPGEKAHAEDVVEDVAKAISAGIFPKADPESWACSEKWCSYYADCRGARSVSSVVTKGLDDG
jgi:hypothetical protein